AGPGVPTHVHGGERGVAVVHGARLHAGLAGGPQQEQHGDDDGGGHRGARRDRDDALPVGIGGRRAAGSAAERGERPRDDGASGGRGGGIPVLVGSGHGVRIRDATTATGVEDS